MPATDARAKVREALAVQCFGDALAVVTLVDYPSEYAMLQNNLGNPARIAPPRVELRFVGACESCPASALTLQATVRKAVQDSCPEITELVAVAGGGLGR